MTLTHILPTLRLSIPDPLHPDLWPALTSAVGDDVIIAGVSLLCLVDWCGTPCVHTTPAPIRGSRGRPSPDDLVSVVVCRVLEVDRHDDGTTDVWVDAELHACRPIPGEARLIGRTSVAHTVAAHLRPSGETLAEAQLPRDVHAGDLIALPCAGPTALHDVRRHAHHPERLAD